MIEKNWDVIVIGGGPSGHGGGAGGGEKGREDSDSRDRPCSGGNLNQCILAASAFMYSARELTGPNMQTDSGAWWKREKISAF